MAFDIVRKTFGKEHLWYVEIEINSTIYRFCENRSPVPPGLDAIPTLSSQRVSPTEVDINGGLGVRASCSVSFDDHMDYAIFGTIQQPVRFWPTWRANHPYYQGARLSLFSGYIINGVFDISNFQRRDYVLETFALTRGKVAITAKDPLKLADNKRAKAPKATTGALQIDIDAIATGFTLLPAGVGDAQYDADGWLRIGSEVMSFTRDGDVFTVERGQYNTIASQHGEGDTAQQCLYLNDTIANIEHRLLTEFANVNPAYIPLSAWQDEAGLYLPGLYETLITEPVGVQELLKETGEQAPHYLYWDERTNLIQFVAVKSPPDTATTLTDEANILENSFAYQDMQDMRVSRVIVHFGQFDPTKKLDEFSNYRQTFVRVDTDSEANYGSAKIRTIYSRWIQNANKAAAIRLAARIGRRFHVAPRMFNFALDAKDADIWTGTPCFVDSAWIVNPDGTRTPLAAQVISAAEGDNYSYRALEWSYGASVPEDDDVDDVGSAIVLSGEIADINLRAVYDSLFPTIAADDDVRFIFDLACTAGGTSAAFAVDTGLWPELDTPPLVDVRGLLIGKGGDGADVDGEGVNGGVALRLQNDIRLSNTGIIGGGGGGGAYDRSTGFEGFEGFSCAGSGGAGFVLSQGGQPSFNANEFSLGGIGGTKTFGGAGVFIPNAQGGTGGGLGQAGETTAESSLVGAGGAAIVTNGYTITYIGAGAGDIRGAIL
jgi:hypothetical protein